MMWLIFLLVFIFPIFCRHQKWQELSDYNRDLLFPNGTVINVSAFYDAQDIDEVAALCTETAEQVEPPEAREAAANDCALYFQHRKDSQKWLDEVFKVLPNYNISVANSAKLKSWFWMMDAKTNSMAEALYCFKKGKYRTSIPVKIWKKMDVAFGQLSKDHPEINNDTFEMFLFETNRRKNLESKGYVLAKHYCD